MRYLLPLILLLAAPLSRGAGTYTNPILPEGSGADPAVIEHEGVFYMYTTNPGLVVYTSEDLVHWERGPQVLPDEFKGVWAPEVYHHPEDGKFYMYYTKRYKIGVAVADRPDAMFEDLGFLAIPAIDAHPFRDDDGRLYLYFTHTPPFTMFCVPMKDPVHPGGPVTRCFEVSQEWEYHHHPLNEGPWMVKADGRYTMLYSGSSGQSIHYATGVATAPTPIGPFTKFAGNPVFKSLPEILGPGHGSVVMDKAGRWWHVYHQKTGDEIGWARDIAIDPVGFDRNGIMFGTPSRGVEQPAPNFDPDLVWIPEIHPRGAYFVDPVEVRVSCRTPGARIRYTLDGSEPSGESPLYEEPFVVSDSRTVRAKAFKEGMKAGAVADERFTRVDETAPNPSPDAPFGDIPFDVFEKPEKDWKPLITKQF